MDCPSDDELLAWLDGQLDGDAGTRLEEHLATCAACRAATLGPARPLLAAGARIGRYRLERCVGAGAMGIVWAARDELLDRPVALKLLRPWPHAEDDDGPARLLREAQVLARLQHPNVIAVYDAGSFGGQVFLVMELLDGESLRQWARGRSPAERLRALVDAGRGLAAAHRAGLIHRDVKPDNILVAASGRVAIGDFGLARPRQEADGSAPAPSPMTTSATAGTPAYMAPELLLGQPADERSDQFSFCMTLYEIMHGARPSETNPPAQRIPRWLGRVLARGLSPSPAARFTSMDALVAALERKRQWPSRMLAVTLALIAIVGGGLLMRQHRRTMRARRACAVGAAGAPEWSVARRDALGRALGTDTAAQPARWAALRTLDAFFAEWTEQRETACRGPIVDEAGEALLLARLACLDGRLDRARALVDLLAEAGKDRARVEAAIDQLPPLAECRSPGAGAPAPPATDDLRVRLAHISALRVVGRLNDAEPLARAAESEAARLGYDPLRAEAACVLGEVYEEQGRDREARAALYRCIWAAEKAHDEHRKARAWATLAYLTGFGHPEGFDEARAFVGNARAALASGRIGGAEAIDVDLFESEILRSTSHLSDSLQVIEQGLAHTGVDESKVQRIKLLDQKAVVLLLLGRHEEALQLAETSSRAAIDFYGRGQPATAPFLSVDVDAQFMMGHYNRAVELAQATLTIESASDEPWQLAAAWSSLRENYEGLGRFDEGLTASLRSLAIVERMTGVDSEALTDELVQSAQLYLELHQAAPAKRLLDRALALSVHGTRNEAVSRLGLAGYDVEIHQARRGLAEARHGVAIWEAGDSAEIVGESAEVYGVLGRVALAAGEPAVALAAYERAITNLEPMRLPLIWEYLYGAARAQAKLGHADGALPLVDRAIAIYRQTDGDSKRLNEMLRSRRSWAASAEGRQRAR